MSSYPVTRATRHSFTPHTYRNAETETFPDSAPVYEFKPLTGRFKIDVRDALRRAGLTDVRTADMRRIAREETTRLIEAEGGDPAEAIALLDAVNDVGDEIEALLKRRRDDPDSVSQDEADRLENAKQVAGHESEALFSFLRRFSPRYNAAVADQGRFNELSPRMTVALALTGVSSVADQREGKPFRRPEMLQGAAADEEIDALPDLDIYMIYVEAMKRAAPTRDEEKNSAPPSGSSASRTASKAANGRKSPGTAGSSETTSSSETPAS